MCAAAEHKASRHPHICGRQRCVGSVEGQAWFSEGRGTASLRSCTAPETARPVALVIMEEEKILLDVEHRDLDTKMTPPVYL